jgi:hypothetical protein
MARFTSGSEREPVMMVKVPRAFRIVRTPISVNRFCFSNPFSCGKPAGAAVPSFSEEESGIAASGIADVVRPRAERAPEACSILRRVSCGGWLSGGMYCP